MERPVVATNTYPSLEELIDGFCDGIAFIYGEGHKLPFDPCHCRPAHEDGFTPIAASPHALELPKKWRLHDVFYVLPRELGPCNIFMSPQAFIPSLYVSNTLIEK